VSEIPAVRSRRGRPPKYGRPAQLVTLTLPDDVLTWLKTLHPDPAWAIVKLAEQAKRRHKPVPLAELMQLPHHRALILVNAEVLKQLPGVAIIPLQDGRGLLALEPNKGVADLELAVIDRLDAIGVKKSEREALDALRARLREWRREGVRFESRAIIVAERSPRHELGLPAPGPKGLRTNSRDVA
jgi:hypothetical protein